MPNFSKTSRRNYLWRVNDGLWCRLLLVKKLLGIPSLLTDQHSLRRWISVRANDVKPEISTLEFNDDSQLVHQGLDWINYSSSGPAQYGELQGLQLVFETA